MDTLVNLEAFLATADAGGFSAAAAAQVIQWHVLGMFAPAFFAGALVDRWGSRRVAMLGSAILATSAAVALSGQDFAHFLASSLLLGLGWNLMLIAGTTLLAEAHAEHERGPAQALMELSNGTTAVLMSFGSGALLAGGNGFVSPATMHWTQSATLLVMVVIGGLGRSWGGPVGAAVWLLLEEALKQHTEHWHMPLGLLLIAVALWAPKGLAALSRRRAPLAKATP